MTRLVFELREHKQLRAWNTTGDGKQVLTVASDGVRYRSAADGKFVKLVGWPAGLTPHLNAVGLSADCRRLLVPCDQGKKVCLLGLPEGREVWR